MLCQIGKITPKPVSLPVIWNDENNCPSIRGIMRLLHRDCFVEELSKTVHSICLLSVANVKC